VEAIEWRADGGQGQSCRWDWKGEVCVSRCKRGGSGGASGEVGGVLVMCSGVLVGVVVLVVC
jgi:hypothetical protein